MVARIRTRSFPAPRHAVHGQAAMHGYVPATPGVMPNFHLLALVGANIAAAAEEQKEI